MKDQLDIGDEVREEKEVIPNVLGPDLLVGSVRAATKAELLASLPPKDVCDKLIDKYFQTSDMGSCKCPQSCLFSTD